MILPAHGASFRSIQPFRSIAMRAAYKTSAGMREPDEDFDARRDHRAPSHNTARTVANATLERDARGHFA